MKIGLTGAAGNAEGIIRQAERAEADGFSSLWYPGQVLGDALAAITLAGRATSTIELGTAIVPTYLCHPVFQASRTAAAAMAIGASGRVTLGVGPSHAPVIEALGMSYATPGRHTEEYVQIVTQLLRGEAVKFSGDEFRTVSDKMKIGRTMEAALQETADRLGTPEFQFFVITLAIQRETGGNLAETLANLADVLRKRAQMKLKIKAMSSESKASAWIVGALPFIVFILIWFINGKYMQTFFTDERLMIAGGGGLIWMGLGVFIMAKMVDFEI